MLPAYFLTLKQFRAGFEKKELNAQLLLMLFVVRHLYQINKKHFKITPLHALEVWF